MIIEIVKDMKYFAFVLFLAVLAFANAFFVLSENSDPVEGRFSGKNFFFALIFSYRMGLGDFDTSGFGTKDEILLWILWLVNTLTILILLLNLVIAIMGDTFDRVQESAENSSIQEVAQMMMMNKIVLNKRKFNRNSKYIIVIAPEKADSGTGGSWEGRLNQLKKFLELSSNEHIKHLEKLDKNLDKIFSDTIDDRLRPLEDKINAKISNVDLRLKKVFLKLA